MVDTRSVRVRISGDISNLNRALASGSANAKKFANDLDSADSRMSNLVQTSLALAPSLVPIGAAAVPAIAGLTSQLAFAAGAAGTFALAFQGIGEALKAVNDYSIEPTSENFAKLQEEMNKLGPAGREFVTFLQDLRPELQHLQNTAREGLFPGAQEGITELMDLMPQVERIVSEIAGASGDLMAEAGDNLNDPRWRDFFDFLEREARPTLIDTGRTLGNFTEGLANLWMAFDPLSDDFRTSLLGLSRDFRDWSDSMENSKGFESFVQYVREAGPQAWETLGALAEALLAVVEAAAPVGQVTLPLIEALAKGLGAVASSPAGPVLIGAAAGISAVSRAVALYNAANGSALAGFLGKVGGGSKGAGAMRAGAAGLGVVALSLTDLDEKANLSKTAMLGMAGAMAGPWGAAIGAAVGFTLDAAAANDDLEESLTSLNRTLSDTPAGFGAQRSALGVARDDLNAFRDDVTSANIGEQIANWFDPGAYKNTIEGLFGQSDIQEAEKRLQGLTEQVNRGREAVAEMAGRAGLGAIDPTNLAGLTKAAERLRPAFEDAGLNFDQIVRAMARGGPAAEEARSKFAGVADEVARYVRQSDSVQGRTRAVAGAFGGLSDRLETTKDKATALSTALDDLLGPELKQDEAMVAWKRSLDELNKDLSKHNHNLNVNTHAGQDNRDAIRERVEALTTSIKADAEAGVGAQRLAARLRDGRQAIIDAAHAAGFSRDEVRKYLNTLNLTPRLVRTILRAVDADKSKGQVTDFIKETQKVPRSIDARVKGDTGDADRDLSVIANKMGQIDRLQAHPKADLDDNASRDIDRVDRGVRDLDRQKANPKADLDGSKANRGLNDIMADLRDLDHQKAVPKAELDDSKARRDINSFTSFFSSSLRGIKNEQVGIDLNAGARSAIQAVSGLFSGGLTFEQGGSVPYWLGTAGRDSVAAMLTPDEHIVTDKEVAAAGKGDKRRGHRVWEGIRHAALVGALPDPMDLPAYAMGGPVGMSPGVASHGVDAALHRIEAAFDHIADQVGDALSAKMNKALQFGGAGQPLGPGGTLSAGQLIRGQQFAKAQDGKPYIWGGVGPGGYDCSGYQSAILNAAMGRNPYSRIGSTSSMPWPGMAGGVGRYSIGWFTGSPGHTSGNIAGLGVESTGDHVRTGSAARSPLDSMFNHIGHYDSGGPLYPGWTAAFNGTGQTERVVKGYQDGGAVTPAERRQERRDKRKQDREDAADKRKEDRQEAREKAREDAQAARELAREQFFARKRGLRGFDISGKEDRSEVRSELTELRQTMREAFGRDSGAVKAINRLDDRLLKVSARHDKLIRSQDKLSERMDNLRQAQRQYASDVAANFRNEEAFGGGLAELSLFFRADRNDARGATADLRRAEHRGLSGGLFRQIAASGNTQLIDEISHLSRREIARYEHLYAQRQHASGALGRLAGHEVYGPDLRDNSRHLHRNNQNLRDNTREMKRLGRRLEHQVAERTSGARKRARSG